jgi:hypothetical protein
MEQLFVGMRSCEQIGIGTGTSDCTTRLTSSKTTMLSDSRSLDTSPATCTTAPIVVPGER